MKMESISRRTLIALVAGVAAIATLASAQAQTTLERAKADGYIRVGFANEAPYGFATPDGTLTGESPEVVKAVLNKMGIAEVDGVLTSDLMVWFLGLILIGSAVTLIRLTLSGAGDALVEPPPASAAPG